MCHLPDGTLLHGGQYKIIRFISQGGFGCTYEAKHIRLNKTVAIKEFFVKDFCARAEESMCVTLATESKRELVGRLRNKFVEEAQAIAEFHHSNVVYVSDIFEDNDTSYFVMDFIEGRTLAEVIKADGPLPESRALGIMVQLCDALGYVHNHKLLHLDIKPSNIMIGPDDHATLIDFGVSKQYDEVGGENTSTLLGYTPGYASVEQMSKSIVKFYPATDIYSLAATLYKMLTGNTPPDANALSSGEPLPPLPKNISKRVSNTITAAMNPLKLKRPQSAAEFRRMLLSGATSSQLPWWKRRMIAIPTCCVALAALIFVVALLLPKLSNTGELGDYLSSTFIQAVDETNLIEEITTRRPVTLTVNDVDFTMIPVDGGEFRMGGRKEDLILLLKQKSALPKNVTLPDYWIGETEVTQELWIAVMGNNPSKHVGDNHPVDNISWEESLEFIERLNELTDNRYHFCLPSEAEWEYAARGGAESKDYRYSGGNRLSSVAWFKDNSDVQSHQVAQLTPNELGIYDMSGNLWEWCENSYDSNNRREDSETGETSNRYCVTPVIRGPGYTHTDSEQAISYRIEKSTDFKGGATGLRLAAPVPTHPSQK